MMMFTAIALGGAIGAMCRYATSLLIISIWGAGVQPAATLLVNALGSGLMGCGYARIGLGLAMPEPLRGLVLVGFLGSLTTFSSFSMDVISMVEKGMVGVALGYALASVVVSLLSFVMMMGLVRALAGGIHGF
ncbi:MAG: CrcB family protein [Alphaproteobacteria bacterium]|nr:CrcB family protein [Alphaproteobacteria bacterium]